MEEALFTYHEEQLKVDNYSSAGNFYYSGLIEQNPSFYKTLLFNEMGLVCCWRSYLTNLCHRDSNPGRKLFKVNSTSVLYETHLIFDHLGLPESVWDNYW